MRRYPVVMFIMAVALFWSFSAHTKTLNNGNHDITVEAALGMGYDSNIYRAPDSEYIDYAQTGNPSVDPETHSGIFVPVELKLEYDGTIDKSLHGILKYDYDGQYYLNSDYHNANTYTHEVSGGLTYIFKQSGRKKDSIYIGPFYSNHYELYNDRDTGEEKASTEGDDLSEGYSYIAKGLDLEYDNRTNKIQFGVDATYGEKDYEDPGVFSQYDYTYYAADGYVEFPVSDNTRLNLSYGYSRKQYDERSARDENGSLFPSNDKRDLTYHELGLTAKVDVSRKLNLYVDYDYKRRTDDYVGYHDYTKHKYAIRLTYGLKKWKLRGKLAYWTRDYDRAYAFENPTQDDLAYHGTQARFSGEYTYSKSWALIARVLYDDENSTDDRYEYDRFQTMAGVKWSY